MWKLVDSALSSITRVAVVWLLLVALVLWSLGRSISVDAPGSAPRHSVADQGADLTASSRKAGLFWGRDRNGCPSIIAVPRTPRLKRAPPTIIASALGRSASTRTL